MAPQFFIQHWWVFTDVKVNPFHMLQCSPILSWMLDSALLLKRLGLSDRSSSSEVLFLYPVKFPFNLKGYQMLHRVIL